MNKKRYRARFRPKPTHYSVFVDPRLFKTWSLKGFSKALNKQFGYNPMSESQRKKLASADVHDLVILLSALVLDFRTENDALMYSLIWG